MSDKSWSCPPLIGTTEEFALFCILLKSYSKEVFNVGTTPEIVIVLVASLIEATLNPLAYTVWVFLPTISTLSPTLRLDLSISPINTKLDPAKVSMKYLPEVL